MQPSSKKGLEMELRKHAETELRLNGMDPNSRIKGPNRCIARHIIKMVDCFAREHHSGSTAAYTIGALEKLLRFEPLTPLTGENDEWNEVADNLWQNKRCSHVFKTDTEAYDIKGRVFVEPNGASFTSNESKVPVTFPYVPHTEYVQKKGVK